MSKPLKQWVSEDVKGFLDKGDVDSSKLFSHEFFRDPSRPQIIDSYGFYAPADGVILYQKEVNPDECIVEVKGRNFTVQDLVGNKNFDQRCLVIGIYMSFADVHMNRVPYEGRYSFKDLSPISTKNRPMLPLEKELFENSRINFDQSSYMFTNQRRINRFHSNSLNYNYYVLQIADDEVDVIVNLHEQGELLAQNCRFGQIRFGSQCDLIMPIYEGMPFTYKLVQQDMWHVEAGVDKLVEIDFINKSEVNKPPKLEL